MNIEQFIKFLSERKIYLTPLQITQFEEYYKLLVEWNEKMNLTGITDKESVYEKHFFDSLTLAFDQDLTNKKLCDVGSGAGFPALPLKIAFPSLQVDIVDSLGKRMVFVEEVIKQLQLKNISTHVARAEEYCFLHQEEYDIVTARAVARLNILIELCGLMVKKGGYLIALKGLNGQEEVEEAKKGIEIMGLKLNLTSTVVLPFEQSTRYNYYLQKIKATTSGYPRMFSKIKKDPL